MPQPEEISRQAERLIEVYRQAEADLARQIADTIGDPRVAGRRARLRQLRSAIDEAVDALEAQTRAWLQETLPVIYEAGGEAGAVSIGDGFTWTQAHVDAVQVLAQETYGEVLQSTRFVRRQVKEWLAGQARARTTAALLEGQTAQQAARRLTVEAQSLAKQLVSVTYKNGALHAIADYADTLIRTTTANAYNAGTLNFLTGAGVGFVEVLDGADCGLTSHDDGEKPNGKVYPLATARLHPLSHPRCRRSFAGRPDVTSPVQAKSAQSLRSAESMADQAANEVTRRVPGLSSRPSTRPARQPRIPRAASDSRKAGSSR